MTGIKLRRALLIAAAAALVVAPAATPRPDRAPAGESEPQVVSAEGAAKARQAKTAELSKQRQFLNYDIRLRGQETLVRVVPPALRNDPISAIRKVAVAHGRALQAGLARLRTKVPTAQVTMSDVTGALEVLGSPDGLTSPSADSGIDIVRRFISENRALYGFDDKELANLHFSGESVNRVSGLRMVVAEQTVSGRRVFQSDTRFVLDRQGRIVKSLGLFAPHAGSHASPLENLISPEQALKATMAAAGITLDVNKMTVSRSAKDRLTADIGVESSEIAGAVRSTVVYFALAPGVVVPVWSQVIFGQDADWYALADASTGTLLWRKNIRADASTHPARFRVYVQADGVTPADSPAPQSPSAAAPGAGTQFAEILPSLAAMLTAQDITASPNGWIDDCPGGGCTVNETQTLGNNALACLDAAAPNNTCDPVLDGNGRPTGNPDGSARNRDFLGTAPRDFETTYLPPPQGGNPEAGQAPTNDPFRRGAITQLFYVTNWYHDRLFTLGFTPAAGNFQHDTFGGGGAGNDRVLLDAHDVSGTNNANFSTPPDGTSGRAQMFRFTGPTVDRDGGLDTEILIHELTHGTSNRLIGNAAGLVWDVGGGMGEGWSDFYGLSLLNNTNADTPTGSYAAGAYATYKLSGFPTYTDNYVYGIRRFPFTTDNSVNPLTWADVDDVTNNLSGGIAPSPIPFNNSGAMEVHNAGEVWTTSLWEVRSRVIADPAGANGNVPTGNETMLSIVTDGMKLTPSNPSFVDGRNALIDADCAANACANEQSIWEGFADRGLGYGAVAPVTRMFGYSAGHVGIGESFAVPNLDVNTVTVDDSGGNNNGFVDPNETVNLSINVKNPWRRSTKGVPSATATLTSSTAGVTILNGSTSYPAIAANGNANPTGTPLSIKAPPAALCGSSLKLTLTITSALGTVARDFTLRLGSPSGTGAAVTYTRNPSPDIAIPDNAPRGVGDLLAITDDLEIADLNFRADSVTHTFIGDLTVLLKAPNGYGTDLIGVIGGAVSGGGSGDNLTNMVIDDTAAAPNDQLTVGAGVGGLTDDWLPTFNAPSWASVGFGGPDPVGNLSRYNGLSTEGTWNLRVSDQFAVDTGTLNQWSMIVTPTAFSCSPTAAGVLLSGRVTDATGEGVSGAVVSLVSMSGVRRGTVTGASGQYRFEDVPVLQTYVVSVSVGSAGQRFDPQLVTVTGDVSNLDFTAR